MKGTCAAYRVLLDAYITRLCSRLGRSDCKGLTSLNPKGQPQLILRCKTRMHLKTAVATLEHAGTTVALLVEYRPDGEGRRGQGGHWKVKGRGPEGGGGRGVTWGFYLGLGAGEEIGTQG